MERRPGNNTEKQSKLHADHEDEKVDKFGSGFDSRVIFKKLPSSFDSSKHLKCSLRKLAETYIFQLSVIKKERDHREINGDNRQILKQQKEP